MPKFNLNWMYMIIALMLLGLWWSNQGGTISKQIPYDEFQQYVREGYVSKVVGYDDIYQTAVCGQGIQTRFNPRWQKPNDYH